MENPYASPRTDGDGDRDINGKLTSKQQRYAEIGEVVVAWERLRVVYNAILAGVALLGLAALLALAPNRRDLLKPEHLAEMILAAIGANACFLAGPIVEGYVTWWLGPTWWLRRLIFVVGTLGAILLTLIVLGVIFFELPAPD